MVDKFKKALEQTYKSTCDVYVFENEESNIVIESTEKLLYQNVKCGLSFKSNYQAIDVNIPQATTIAKLFLNPSYDIPINSKIIVNHLGKQYTFYNTSSPAIYDTHQEIELSEIKNA